MEFAEQIRLAMAPGDAGIYPVGPLVIMAHGPYGPDNLTLLINPDLKQYDATQPPVDLGNGILMEVANLRAYSPTDDSVEVSLSMSAPERRVSIDGDMWLFKLLKCGDLEVDGQRFPSYDVFVSTLEPSEDSDRVATVRDLLKAAGEIERAGPERYADALTALQKAIDAAVNSQEPKAWAFFLSARCQRAWIFLLQHRGDEALKECDWVISSIRETPHLSAPLSRGYALYYRAFALLQLGRNPEARQAFEYFIQQADGYATAADALAMLAECKRVIAQLDAARDNRQPPNSEEPA